MKRLPVLALLLWICCVFYVGIFLFVGGFLLVRLEVNRTSTCEDVLPPSYDATSPDFCPRHPRVRRAVILVVDALKAEFARYDPGNLSPRPFENKLPVLGETVSSRASHARLYTFRADPPTTTMQRIKGFTTGSLPTFIDVGNNFASSAVLEDNLIHQLGQAGEREKEMRFDGLIFTLMEGVSSVSFFGTIRGKATLKSSSRWRSLRFKKRDW